MTSAWPLSTVGDQFDVQLGKMLDAARNAGDPKPYLGNRAVQWGRIDLSAVGVVPLSRSDLQRFRLKDGDLLVCEGGEVGRAAVWRSELSECYYQKALHRLRPKANYDVRLMVALLEYWSSIGAFADYVTQTSIAHLPREKFIRMPLPVPAAKEQRQIGDALEDAGDLIASIERLTAKKQAVKLGLMQQLLTRQTRLPGFVDEWRQSTLRAVADVKTGPFGSALHERDYVSRGTPIITVEHLGEYGVNGNGAPMVSDADRQRLKAYALTEGDIVFSRVGSIDRNARISVRESGWLFSGRLLRLRFKSDVADSRFMSVQFNSKAFIERVKAVAVGQTMPSLNTAILNGIEILLPSLKEQQRIGEIAEEIDADILQLQRRLAKARAVKAGIMQQLLTGRTRLSAEAGS